MTAKFKRGDVVLRPDQWEHRGKMKRGKAVVVEASAKRVMLCTFTPGTKISPSNPHVGYYRPAGLVAVGHVKKMPKACRDVVKRKAGFYKQHPFFKENPHKLAGAGARLMETKTADNVTAADIRALRDNGSIWYGKARLCAAALRGERNARDRVASLINARAAAEVAS